MPFYLARDYLFIHMAKKEVDEENKKASQPDYSDLIKQTTSEWEQGWWHVKPRWDEWALRLKLYNNQKRDKDSVGDTTLFSVFQTVLASLYEDKLAVTFSPREIGDDEVAENLNITAEYDYELMQKDVVDYEWDFETMFFGRGLLCTMEFDRDTLTPAPVVWNAMTVVRDPEAASVNGDRKGRGKARYLYRETRLCKGDFEKLKDVYFNYEDLKPSTSYNNSRSPLDQYARLTAEAAGLGDIQKYANVFGDNATFRVREGFTRYNGKLVFVTIADEGKRVIRYQEIDREDMPIIDRVLFPIPNNWDSVSIPDLVEDKQRARAVALNLSLKGVKANLHPMYLFDRTKIDERSDFNFEFNKFIPVNGSPDGAVVPMTKDHIKQDVSYIMDTLDISAQKATGTPDIKQGARPDSDSTATRDALVAQGSDSRYSLSARIFGWSERRFWLEWYKMLDEHMDDEIDEKVVRVVGALGATWRPFKKKDLIPQGINHRDPDVKVESKAVADAKRFNDAQLFRDYMQMAIVDPTAQVRFGLRHYGKLIGLKTDLIEQIFPPTVEELRAEDENKMIEAGEKAMVLPTDDHYLHMQIHNKLADSKVKTAHINAHKRALLLAKLRPDMVPPQIADQPVVGGQVAQGMLPQPTPETAQPRKLPVQR